MLNTLLKYQIGRARVKRIFDNRPVRREFFCRCVRVVSISERIRRTRWPSRRNLGHERAACGATGGPPARARAGRPCHGAQQPSVELSGPTTDRVAPAARGDPRPAARPCKFVAAFSALGKLKASWRDYPHRRVPAVHRGCLPARTARRCARPPDISPEQNRSHGHGRIARPDCRPTSPRIREQFDPPIDTLSGPCLQAD